MGTIDPIKIDMLVECTLAREEFGSSKRFKGIAEINEKKLTNGEAIHVDEVDKDNRDWDNLWGIANTLLFAIVEKNENAIKQCIGEDIHDVEVDAKAMLHNLLMYSMIVRLYYQETPIHNLD